MVTRKEIVKKKGQLTTRIKKKWESQIIFAEEAKKERDPKE